VHSSGRPQILRLPACFEGFAERRVRDRMGCDHGGCTHRLLRGCTWEDECHLHRWDDGQEQEEWRDGCVCA